MLTNNNVPYVDLYILLNDQHGGFTQVPTNYGYLSAQAVLADLNGDAYLDLLLSSGSAGVTSVYLGNGTGQFNRV